MDYTVSWGGEAEDLSLKTSGSASVDDLHEMVNEVLEDERFRTGMKVLVDHTDASWRGLSRAEIRRRADLLAQDAARIGPQRIAFVVSRQVDFGLGRMLEGLIYDRTLMQTQIFDSLEAARAWLNTP